MINAAAPLAGQPAPPDRVVAFGSDVKARVRLGSAVGTAPELLYLLARDEATTVRAAVAMNAATPARARAVLAEDEDERVRALLGRALAALAGTPSAISGDPPCKRAMDTLAKLVGDAAVRVRAAIADALAELPEAPRDLVLRLARDAEVPVSEPILRLSPLLTAADLLALLGEPPTAETATAVARRPSLNPAVSRAIAATGDTVAIRALLANPSAAIQEDTLDALIARASHQADWHEPLVLRPTLPPHAAKALAEFVATHLLQYLTTRPDLDPLVTDALRIKLVQRLAAEQPAATRGPASGLSWSTAPRRETDAALLAEAKAMAAAGGLTEASLLAACRAGDPRRAATRLAVAAHVTIADVDHAAALRSGKALISLLWKAGFGMAPALAIQATLANLAPDRAVGATPDGEFPFTADEMRWQVDVLSRSAV